MSNAELYNIFDYLICKNDFKISSQRHYKTSHAAGSGMSLVIVFLIRYINTDHYRVYNITIILTEQNN